MWARGWLVLGKSILAYLIVAAFLSPIGWFGAHAARSPEHPSIAGLVFIAFGICLYFPLVCMSLVAGWDFAATLMIVRTRQRPIAGVQPRAVIEGFDVVEDGAPRLCPGGEALRGRPLHI